MFLSGYKKIRNMIIISHRGNLLGPNPSKENSPAYIDDALRAGFHVEIDLRVIDGKYFLGHDGPEYEIDPSWLSDGERSSFLYIHCKNVAAVEAMTDSHVLFNYFWHESDKLTLTSLRDIWVFPGNQPIEGSIAVMPEIHKDDVSKCFGICTDYPIDYAEGRM
jgi:hypothetical protein